MKNPASNFFAALCICLFSAVIAKSARAEFYPAGASLTNAEITERLDFLDRRFKSQKSDAELWEYGWGAFNGGTMAWNAFSASQDTKTKDRSTDIVEAVEGLVGLSDIIFRPLPTLDANAVCSGKVDSLQCLAAKEDLARRSAERANEPYELLPHAEILGANLLAGAVVWRLATFGRALVTAIPGELIGEAQLWTMPRQPTNDFDEYRLKFSPIFQTDRSKASTVGLQVAWRF